MSLHQDLELALLSCNKTYDKIIFVCIGTDRCIGDSLGPIVGSILQEKLQSDDIRVYGTIDDPVHARNIEKVLREIDTKINLVIAVDAMIGGSVGSIRISNRSIKPGNGVGKNLPEIGDIAVSVTTSNDGNFLAFQSIRLSFIYGLARRVTNIITDVFQQEASLKEAVVTKDLDSEELYDTKTGKTVGYIENLNKDDLMGILEG